MLIPKLSKPGVEIVILPSLNGRTCMAVRYSNRGKMEGKGVSKSALLVQVAWKSKR